MCGYKIVCVCMCVCLSVRKTHNITTSSNFTLKNISMYLQVVVLRIIPSSCYIVLSFLSSFPFDFFLSLVLFFLIFFSYKFFNKQFFLLCFFYIFLFQQTLYTPCVVLCLLNIKYVTLLMLL